MKGQLPKKNREWLWLSLAAAACFFSGAVLSTALASKDEKPKKERGEKPLSTAYRLRRKKPRIIDDTREAPCKEDGDKILEQLQKEDWFISTAKFFDELEFSSMSDVELTVFARELKFLLRKNVMSMEVACERYQTKIQVVHMLKKILKVYKDALKLLKPFASELGINIDGQVLSAGAQCYPNSICFLADHGTCAEMVAALAISYPSWAEVCEKLRDDLMKHRSWSSDQLELLNGLAKPIEHFDNISVRALNEGLESRDTSKGRIVSSARVLKESEKLFWQTIAGDQKKKRTSSAIEAKSDEDEDWVEDDDGVLNSQVGIPAHLISSLNLFDSAEIEAKAGAETKDKDIAAEERKIRRESGTIEEFFFEENKDKPDEEMEISEIPAEEREKLFSRPQERYLQMSLVEQEFEMSAMKMKLTELGSNFNEKQDIISPKEGDTTDLFSDDVDEDDRRLITVSANLQSATLDSDCSDRSEKAAIREQLTQLAELQSHKKAKEVIPETLEVATGT